MNKILSFLLAAAWLLPSTGHGARSLTPPPLLISANAPDDRYLVTEIFWTFHNPSVTSQNVTLRLDAGSAFFCESADLVPSPAVVSDNTFQVSVAKDIFLNLPPGARRIVQYFFLCANLTTNPATIIVSALVDPAKALIGFNPSSSTVYDYQGSVGDNWSARRPLPRVFSMKNDLRLFYSIRVAEDRGAITASVSGRIHNDLPQVVIRGSMPPPYLPLNSGRPF